MGMTQDTRRVHIIRAALESVAYQSMDILAAMEEDAGEKCRGLWVEGGITDNAFLMQFQADILGGTIRRPEAREPTALGAACLAGLAVGFWDSLEELRRGWKLDRRYDPVLSREEAGRLVAGWREAVSRSLAWAKP